jgi:AcrR family transcriptional regulator
MVRIVKTPDERRSELIACAQKLFYDKGYDTTSVSDIVDEAGVAKGTFYYYFDSKLAILEALVDVLIDQSVALLNGIVSDETLPALAKWERAFRVVADWKMVRKSEMLALLRVMQKPENVLLQYKVRTQSVRALSPELARIIAQGVDEGVFETDFAADSAEIVLSAMQAHHDLIAGILLNPGGHENPAALARRKIASVETAIERILSAPQGSLSLIDDGTFAAWFEDQEPTAGKLSPDGAAVSMELDDGD